LVAGPGGAKRFYEAVSVSGEADGPRNGHRILLDGKRSVRTPGGSILDVPHRELGHAVALEWDTQRPRVIPAAMPLTSLLSTAVDAVSDQMGAGELSDKAAV
jgi:chaperone required for assembly of F1-ATPase